MRKLLVIAGLVFLILPLSLFYSSELTSESLVDSLELTAANNTLNITVTSAVELPAALRNPRIDLEIQIISWTEANGTEHSSNVTKSYSWFPDSSGWSKSISFEELRPDSAAVSIRGYVIAGMAVEEGQIFYNVNGSQYSTVWEDRSSYWLANVYDNDYNLVAVYSYGKESKTQEFELNFENSQLSLVGSQSSLPAEWSPIEGCGTPRVPKLGGFSVTYYASNPSTASSVLGRVADQIRSDSHNLSWIESFEVKDAVDFTQLAESKNKTVSELIPADFSFYQHPTGGVTIIDVPSEINMGASGVAGPGIIFVYSPNKDVLLHELAHQAGWCDPDPYGQWKDYWNSYVMPETSQFTNETWYTKLSDTKLWVSLISDPICPASRTTNLVFSVRSSEEVSLAWSVQVSEGSVSPSSGTITATPDGVKFAVLYQPPPGADLSSAYVELELSANGESRVFHFPLLIVPESYGNVTLNTTAIPDYSEDNYTTPDTYLQDLSNYYGQISTQLQDLIDANNYTKPEALQAAERAKMNLMKAQEDLQTAMQKNDTCVRNLLREAANYRQMAAQYWLNYANYLQNTLNLGPISFSWTALSSTDIQNAKQMAEAYEKKAVSFEIQAQFGCPSGPLSGQYGLNPLIAFYSMLASSTDQSSVVNLVYWALLLTGGLLFIVGVLQAIATKGKRWQLMIIGLVLVFIALGISTFAGLSTNPFSGFLNLGGGI